MNSPVLIPAVDSDLAIVEDVIDIKLGTTIRQGFALPKPDLSTFNGNPMVYWSFIRSFENSIERNATSESEKLIICYSIRAEMQGRRLSVV